MKAEDFVREHADRASNGAGESLPSWDLSDLYPGLDSPELESELTRAAKAVRSPTTTKRRPT